jgi:copper homeostasis protein
MFSIRGLSSGRPISGSFLVTCGACMGAAGIVFYYFKKCYLERETDYVEFGYSLNLSSRFVRFFEEFNMRCKRGTRKPKNFDNTIEVCLSDISSIVNAIHGGATSLELCTNRAEGGVTPSVGLVEEAVRLCRTTDSTAVHVLIRPRPGHFVYSNEEFEVILRDILAAKSAGADGVVVGILREDGTIDEDSMRVVRKLSEGMMLTFHRAFDVCSQDIDVAVDIVERLGCDRLLTSGRHSAALEGWSELQRIVNATRAKSSHLKIIAASGVTVGNAVEIIQKTGVHGVHAGSSVCTPMFSEQEHYIPSRESSDKDLVPAATTNATTQQARNDSSSHESKNGGKIAPAQQPQRAVVVSMGPVRNSVASDGVSIEKVQSLVRVCRHTWEPYSR